MNELALFKPFGVDLFCLGRKFLVFNLVSRNLKIKYRRSSLGVVWTLLSPLGLAAMYYIVFKYVLNTRTPHYVAFVISGILPWNFFSQTMMEGTSSILEAGALLTKVPIPIQTFPYVVSLTNVTTLMLAIPILILASVVSNVSLGPSLILVPVYFIALFFITYALSLTMGIGYVYFRDLKHLIGLLTQMWMWGTPVIYDVSMVPSSMRWVIYVNPVAMAFTGLHTIFAEGAWPRAVDVLVLAGWTLASLVLASLFHRRFGRDVAENL